MTTSWSMPISPPDGPQVRENLRAVCCLAQNISVVEDYWMEILLALHYRPRAASIA